MKVYSICKCGRVIYHMGYVDADVQFVWRHLSSPEQSHLARPVDLTGAGR